MANASMTNRNNSNMNNGSVSMYRALTALIQKNDTESRATFESTIKHYLITHEINKKEYKKLMETVDRKFCPEKYIGDFMDDCENVVLV